MNFRWWKELDFTTKLPFARDRLVECYFWMLGVYFEPQYVQSRRFLTKVIAMISILDDIYDAYGTIEELNLFTEAIERFDEFKFPILASSFKLYVILISKIYMLLFFSRWDINSIDHLPEYMKYYYVALLDVYKEIEKEMEKAGYQYRVHYAIEVVGHLNFNSASPPFALIIFIYMSHICIRSYS